jgi:hypothetical protein
MCELRRVLVLLATLFGGTECLAGQSAPARDRQALQERIETLIPLVNDANRRARAADSMFFSSKGEAGEQETIRVGPLTIVALTGQAEEARELFAEAWSAYAPLFGTGADYFTYFVFAYHRGSGEGPVVPRSLGIAKEIDFGYMVSRETMRESVRSALSTALANALPGEITAWEGSIPIELPSEATHARVYRDLVLAPSPAAQACLSGDERDCWSGMGVVEEGANPLTAWYSANDQRIRVEKSRYVDPQAESLRGLCMSGNPPACSEWLATFIPLSALAPVPNSARASLIEFALRRGGAGALERLNDEFGSFESRSAKAMGRWARAAGPELPQVASEAGSRLRAGLEAASGTDAATLMREWQASIAADAPDPDPVRPTGSSRNVTIAWLLVFAGLAARSTRWRLG